MILNLAIFIKMDSYKKETVYVTQDGCWGKLKIRDFVNLQLW